MALARPFAHSGRSGRCHQRRDVNVYTGPVRRIVPLFLVAALVILVGVTTVVSLRQSRASASGVRMDIMCTKKVGKAPSSLVLSCADANSKLTALRWTDWGDATAYATGRLTWNDCTPTCVSGHWKGEPVTLWAWRVRDDRYTRLTSNDPRFLTTLTLSSYPP